ncbi:MAG: insulinase family protein [bacterium]|nr:insulinase family protein [bacterium]
MGNCGGCPAPTLKAGDRLHGFTIIRVQQIPEIRVTAYEARHDRCGARVLHLHCDDRENLFSIGFRTTPSDSTGLPHILEHSVLAGSERYPVKDAFNELAKGSLKTFINAFTYPDKTVYPVASQVKADFYNLARVYMDLVLRPRLLLHTFQQEGYHFEPENPSDPDTGLTISGIVYNEMKGLYSSADSLQSKYIMEGLYPDSTYGYDAGGDPEEIPNLTYEQFKRFHQLYYSPSNAWIFFYGSITTRENLEFLEEMLAGFDHIEVNSQIKDQPLWTTMRRIHNRYPISREEKLERKSIVDLAWIVGDSRNPQEILLLQIAAIALVGSAGAPLRKALIDSGLGEDLSPATGLERDLKQVPFIVGLRGTDPDKADQIERLIFDTLEKIVRDGFDPQLIHGALHQVEFHGKEITRNSMPYGLTLMSRAYCTWLYEADPLAGLQFSTLIEEIRQKWQDEPRLFENLIRRKILENTHCLRSVMEPSYTYQEEKEAAFRRKMAEYKASLSKAKLEEIFQNAEKLRKEQAAPDSPQALASLPRLELADIPREIETIPTRKTTIGGVPALEHDIFSNGIVYLDLAFDISDLPDDLQPYLPLLATLTLGMGAAGKGYDVMSSQIALKIGGLSASPSAGQTVMGEETWQKMIFRMKMLHRNIPDAVQLLDELLTQGDLSDRTRMQNLLAEEKNDMLSAVVPQGHAFARRTASAGLSLAHHRDEQWNGLAQLRLLVDLAERFSRDGESLAEKMAQLRAHIYRRGRVILNLTGDAEGLDELRRALEHLVQDLPPAGEPKEITPFRLETPVPTGVAIQAQVCYMAQVLPAPRYLSSQAPALSVLSHELASGPLYNRIRVQGGAYGAHSIYDSLNGNFAFLSYRDPNLEQTIKVYRQVLDEVSSEEISAEELRKAIISTIASLDKPMGPGAKGFAAMIWDFAGISDEHRQRFKEEVLKTTPQSVRQVAAEYLRPRLDESNLAVYAAEDRLKRASEQMNLRLRIEPLLGRRKVSGSAEGEAG